MTPDPLPPSTPEQIDRVRSSLLDLLFELGQAFSPLTICGGFGLILKHQHLERVRANTLIGRPELWPRVRPTRDLDLITPLELLAEVGRRRALAAALDRLGYKPIEESKYWQFALPGDPAEPKQGAKVDLLGGPLLGSLSRFGRRFQKDDRRWKPKGKGQPPVHLHARKTPEAVGVEDEPLAIPIEGLRSTGEHYQATVCLPQAFPYAMMKLFAFRDRKDDPDPRKDKGRHHALDLYAVVAMTTEPEYEFAKALRSKYADNEKVREAGEIVRGDFAGPESIGVLRLREHILYDAAMDLNTFLGVLREIFP
jgi:hypothetical protein